VLDVVIPGLSTLSLLGVTLYVCMDAYSILTNPPAKDDVNTNYLYGYATVNLCVDLACGLLFSLRGEDVFVEASQAPKLSLDTSISFDQVRRSCPAISHFLLPFVSHTLPHLLFGFNIYAVQEEGDFGHLEDDLDGYMASEGGASSTWNPFGAGAGAGNGGAYAAVRSGEGSGSAGQAGTQVGLNCCANALKLWAAYFKATCCCCCTASSNTANGSTANGGNSTGGGNADANNKKNLNMMSAFTHIMGDTLRTVSMLLAALVATITGIDGDICDAWAALVVSLTILVLCASLTIDICVAGRAIWTEEFAEGAPSGGRGRSRRSSGSSSSVLGSVAYRRVNDLECDDLDDGVEV
jgi:Co/Zn/Cd efflux system component